MTLVAGLEILLWGRILLSAIMFQRGSWILLVIYTVFLRARHAQSSFVQTAFANLGARGDAMMANQSADPRLRQGWESVKAALRSAHDATELNKYGPTTEAKKAE